MKYILHVWKEDAWGEYRAFRCFGCAKRVYENLADHYPARLSRIKPDGSLKTLYTSGGAALLP